VDILLLTLIYTGASFIQGVTGFGFATSSVPLVALLFGPGAAVGMNAIVGTTNCVYNFYLLRRKVEYLRTLKVLLISAVFVPAGAYLLVRFDERLIFVLMGTMVVVVAVRALQGKDGNESDGAPVSEEKRGGKRFYGLLPPVAGMLSGAFASPGPAMVPYMFSVRSDPFVAKANLQYFFSLISVFVIASHLVTGNINLQNTLRALPYLPLVFVFTKIGALLSFRLGRNTFRRIVNFSLLILGIYLILKNGSGLLLDPSQLS
jgi:hypothetical protein